MLSSDQWARRAVLLEEINKVRNSEEEHKDCILEYIERSIEELNQKLD